MVLLLIAMNKKACILGATGLVGSELLSLLLHDDYYAHVNIIVRRKIAIPSKRLLSLLLILPIWKRWWKHFMVMMYFAVLVPP
jgi:GDP-D-mannose dehydratase